MWAYLHRAGALAMAAIASYVAVAYLGGPTGWHLEAVIASLAIGAAGGALWTRLRGRFDEEVVFDRIEGALRLFLAAVFILYAVAKILRTQFSLPVLYIHDVPLGQLTGFELTWSFFGYSYTYALFVAGGQLAAAALLAFRRTQLLGALVLLPIIANIVVLNITHGIPVRFFSAVFLAITLYLIAIEGDRLLALFWHHREVPPRPRARVRSAWPEIAGRLAYLAAVTLFVTWALSTAKARGHQPTRVSGAWVVAETEGEPPTDTAPWKTLYFEDVYWNGWNGAVLRHDDDYARGRFRLVDAEHLELQLMLDGERVDLEARYVLVAGDPLRLELTFGDEDAGERAAFRVRLHERP